MTTAQEIFRLALALMDELGNGGSIDTTEHRPFRERTIPILNVLVGECYPYSDTYAVTVPGKRPICPPVEEMEQAVGLDDGLCRGVLPYGLAAQLLLGEDDQRAAFFQEKYEEQLLQLAKALPTEGESIVDCYGGIEYGQFARW